MKFDTLKEKSLYYRDLADHRLIPNSYVIAMVDGHCFSKLIKNRFNKPFDDDFIDMMNKTAQYLCENIQGAKFAYTQSDEISILITDFDTPMTDSFFSYRICKMQSLIAAMATAKFNQLYAVRNIAKEFNTGNTVSKIMNKEINFYDDIPLCTFDCKVWNVPNANEAYAWFLFRQTDCIKNSKAQTAQSYLPHKTLLGHNADEMIALTKELKGVDWNDYPDDRKFGRIITKTEQEMEKDITRKDGSKDHIKFMRNIWTPVSATDFKENNEFVKSLIPNI